MENKFYCVHDWMTEELGLRGSERDVFAVIFSFAESRGVYSGGLQYLGRRTGTTKPTVTACLRKLLEKDLLRKQERIEKGVRLCEYRVSPQTLAAYLPGQAPLPEEDNHVPHTGQDILPGEVKKSSHPGQENLPGEVKKVSHPGQEILPEAVKKVSRPGKETLHNNKRDNKENNKEDNKEREQSSQKPVRHKYGEYGNVLLSDEEADKLKREFPDDWRKRIERLSEYMASTGKSYRNHLATIRIWAKKDAPPDKPKGRFDDLKGGCEL